ncbi:hypothetical protein HAT2_00665 [Candidatus Similichlamydia laticola]|uniref:Uncharacterized protein n=1 Tax=Candidatus Similichlamydia laticola TaxID=2170265 RepID=A0A369KES0_9BACT|nr:hypothetical protein HAT2_00665 [Candidatus Similichlamydia laticola]
MLLSIVIILLAFLFEEQLFCFLEIRDSLKELKDALDRS